YDYDESERLQGNIENLKLLINSTNDGPAEEARLPSTASWDQRGRDHWDPLENYAPEGWEWERLYPEIVAGAGTRGYVFAAGNNGQRNLTLQEIDLWSLSSKPGAPGAARYLAGTQNYREFGARPTGFVLPASFDLQAVNGNENALTIETDAEVL